MPAVDAPFLTSYFQYFPSESTTFTLLILLLCVYLFDLVRRYLQALRNIDHLSGTRTLFSVVPHVNRFLPPLRGLFLGIDYPWDIKHDKFRELGCDVHSTVALFPPSESTQLWLADADTIKDVLSSRIKFPKPIELYTVLNLFGPNIVASEYDDWKKYRKISSPAFSERNNRLVWEETMDVMHDLFENVWGDQPVIETDNVNDITLPIALSVLSAAGFGRPIRFNDSEASPSSVSGLSFKDALHTAAHDIWWRLALPRWAMGFFPRFRRLRAAFDDIENFMREMIEERKRSGKSRERFDLFDLLLDANEESESTGGLKLTDSELMGNLFTFLLGGHEAAAHTLCYTFGCLALYQDEQELLYQEVRDVVKDRVPTYDDMLRLPRVTAVFYETLRLYPPINIIPKYAAEDTVITTTNAAGQTKTIPVPKQTKLLISTPGLHYNPRYWPDPERFQPERFLKDYNRDAFLPFSAGPRSCIGRKFFETEVIAVLALMIFRYHVRLKEDPQFAHETLEQRRARLFAARTILTLTPYRMPVIFTRRKN